MIALVTVLAIGASLLVTSYVQDPVYRASMKIVVGQGGGVFQPEFGATVQPFTQTMTNLLESDIVASTVIDNLALDIEPKVLLSNLQVSTRPESAVLEMSYDAPSKKEAVLVLSETGTVFARLVDQRLGSRAEPRTAGAQARLGQITASVFDPAHLEPDRVAPRPQQAMLIAGVLGLGLGLVLAFARDALDDRIRSRRDAEWMFRAPVIGAIPKGSGSRSVVGVANGTTEVSREVVEALYLLRANLQFSEAGISGPVLVVTSALPREGKSIVAANVAATLALAGSNVICVEADVRRPELHAHFGLAASEEGMVRALERDDEITSLLTEVSLHRGDLELSGDGSRNGDRRFLGGSGFEGVPRAIIDPGRFPMGRLRVLQAGKVDRNPADLLTRARAARLVESLRARADYVIFDTPPMLTAGDAFPLMSLADTVLVVARLGRTRRGAAEAVHATLDRLGVQRASVVLTDAITGGADGYAVSPEFLAPSI